MEFDSFFNSQRWRILELVSSSPSSPLEISEKINTSVAYVSQQLKLFEAAGLIVKKRTGSVEKGKPRTLFSLKKEVALVTALINGNPLKQLFNLDKNKRITLNIWSLEKKSLHAPLERFFWDIEDKLEAIKAIYLDTLTGKPTLVIFTNAEKSLSSHLNKLKGISSKIHSQESISSFSIEKLHPIYESESLIVDRNTMKGGR